MTTPSQIRRPAFFVSDRTGITSENVGDALLEQFDGIKFKRATYPFIDTQEKAHALVHIINKSAEESGIRPLIFPVFLTTKCAKSSKLRKACI